MSDLDDRCERCGAEIGQPCRMMKCNGFCRAARCDDQPHDHELEIAEVHQCRLRARRQRGLTP